MSGNLEYILLGIICVLATICAFVAKKKGYSFWHWFFAAILTYECFFLSMFIMSFLPKLNTFDEESQDKVFEANKKYAWGIILGHIVFKVFEISINKLFF